MKMFTPNIRLSVYLSVVCAFVLMLANCNRRPHESAVSTQDSYASKPNFSPAQLLGSKLFFDTTLSNPVGQSCASCHMPNRGFADPVDLPVSRGATHKHFGTRNAPTIAYAAFTPYFHFDSAEEHYVGGLFWDGRSATLSEQAVNPLLSHNEMNNKNKKVVVEQVMKSDYKDLFLYVYGPHAFDNTDTAFEYITEAIEEFEETAVISPFTSKFDYYLRGMVEFTPAEKRGLDLFNDTAKGNCAACHPSTPDPYSNAVLFTDFTYDNLGLPANDKVKELCENYCADLGLGAFVKKSSENGKFKVPTLRNVAITAPYFHNGIYKTLEEVMDFYNNRDTGKFGEPEVKENVNHDELGNLKLTRQEISDIIAFMKTLTDGYNLPAKSK
jgi:cytochrome c peroxidase